MLKLVNAFLLDLLFFKLTFHAIFVDSECEITPLVICYDKAFRFSLGAARRKRISGGASIAA